MKKVTERLLVFFIGVPAVVGIVLFLDFQNHLPLNIVVILFSAAGAVEFASMLEKKQMRISKIKAFILGALAPAALALTINFNLPAWIIPLLVMAGISWAVVPIAFSSAQQIETAASRLAAGLSVIVYPGFFMYWLVKMTSWEKPGVIILIFLLIPLCSDAAAWLTGTLLGKNNKGLIPASPNKSIAGFIGGIAGSVIISTGAALLAPEYVFIPRAECVPAVFLVIILGIFTGIASTLGDLAESAIKRSCDTKDSGNLMLGRGGILDSIDSIATAAPVFFVLYWMFFNH